MTLPIRASQATLLEVRQALQRIEQNRRTGATHHFTATAAPTADDDESAGYSATSMWYWVASDFLFICTDATKGAAQWYNPFDGAAAFGQGATATAGTGHNYGKIVTDPATQTLEASGKTDTFTLKGTTGGIVVSGVTSGNVLTITGAGTVHAHDHTTDLTNVGTNTHTQIDTHIADTVDPHGESVTLTTPTIGDFTNATHDHEAAAGGGNIDHTAALTNAGTNTHAQLDSLAKFFQGTFLESFDALVIEDAGAVKMTLEQSGGGDLTMVFSDGYTILDCTPIINVPMTEGADAQNPQKNYVYILKSTKTLAASTTGWPTAEHIKVGFFLIQTDVEVAASGALINQNWNDHAVSTSGAGVGQGHLTHMAERSRRLGAIWLSGCEGVATQDGNDLWVSIAAGVVSQAHPHTFPALDSDAAGAGDTIDVVNDPDGAYRSINSLNEITKLSDGTAIGNNKYVKLDLWAVSNKSGTYSPMMLDLPGGQYNTAAGAEVDVEGHADFSIPPEFTMESTTGFLVASFVCKHTATAMEIITTIDQRGRTPATAGGAGTGGGDVTAAAAITDHAIVRGDGGAKGVQDSVPTIDDAGAINMGGQAITNVGNVDGVDVSAHLADTSDPHGSTMSVSVQVTTPKIYSVQNVVIEAFSAAFPTTVSIVNSHAGQVANLSVEGAISVGTTVDGRDIAADGAILDTALLETLVDVKGDLLVATADDTVVRLPVGGNLQQLHVNVGEASGLEWRDYEIKLDITPQLGAHLDLNAKYLYDNTRAYVQVHDQLYVDEVMGVGTIPLSFALLAATATGSTQFIGVFGGVDYSGAVGTAAGLQFTATHGQASPAGHVFCYGSSATAEIEGVAAANKYLRSFGVYTQAVNSGAQDQATANILAHGVYVDTTKAGTGANAHGNFFAYGIYVKEPDAPTGATTTNQEWSALFEGDVQINSDKKLILEGSGIIKGDSYVVFNSSNSHIEFWIDGVLEGYVDGAGFNSV